MDKKVLLVDVDGTVLDKQKMWLQLECLFKDTFPHIAEITSLRSYYNLHKGKDHLVERAVVAMVDQFKIENKKFKQIFDQVDYERCFYKDIWSNIQQWARKEDGEIIFFTQGTKWVQQAKRKQMDTFLQKDEYFLQTNYDWYIFERNKMDYLGEVKQDLEVEGKIIIGLADDMEINIMRANKEHGLPSYFRK